jgi:protein O-GlcNAc transferase
VSGDFREHAVAHYFGPVVENHDKACVEVFCYSNHPRVDAVTRRLMAHADHWRSLVGLSDDDAAAIVQRDAIDVLVDLSGHTGYNRLLVFARKPAPVQVTWMGLPCTTGLAAMDYRLTNSGLDPEGVTDPYGTETLVRLSAPACYAPPDLPPLRELPALANGFVTFASFNDISKVSPVTYRAWAAILSRLPSARLVLVCDAQSSAHARETLIANGVEAARLTFFDKLPFADYLALHGSVDLALDTFPYNGSTTTRMALWMGVPVVTLPGATPISRAGYALQAGAGLHAFIAKDEDDYVETALRWSTDLSALAEVRRTMRSRLRAAPMTDAKLGTRDVEAAYRRMWQTWCTNATPAVH